MINMNAVTIESAEQKDYASWLPLWINYQTLYRTIISDEVSVSLPRANLFIVLLQNMMGK